MAPLRSFRAAAPLAFGLAAALAPMTSPLGGALALGLGGLGAAAVLIADRLAPTSVWRRRFPTLTFAGVRRLPRRQREVEALFVVCTAVATVLADLDTVQRSRRRALRQRLHIVVRTGADLAVARERAGDDADQQTRALLDARLEELVPAVLQLRATLLRTGASRAAAPEQVHGLLQDERRLAAEVGSVEELREVERWTRFAS